MWQPILKSVAHRGSGAEQIHWDKRLRMPLSTDEDLKF